MFTHDFIFKKCIYHFVLQLSYRMNLTQHIQWPYTWWGWTEPQIDKFQQTSTLPLLQGISLSPSTKKIYEEVTGLINQHTKLQDTIYEFPHMPIFYLLSHKILKTIRFLIISMSVQTNAPNKRRNKLPNIRQHCSLSINFLNGLGLFMKKFFVKENSVVKEKSWQKLIMLFIKNTILY